MSFTTRDLRFTFLLGTGVFGSGGQNTTAVSQLRATAKISMPGAPATSTLTAAVYGMKLSDMNQLSTLGLIQTQVRRNIVQVEAGDPISGYSIVFTGIIYNAWIDGNNAPDVPFRIEAQAGLYEAIAPSPVTSYKGAADVANIISTLAKQAGFTFKNDGVNGVILQNPYFEGAALQQIRQAAEAANINWLLDKDNLLVIWPKGASRNTSSTPLIQPAPGGMVGYPSFDSLGVQVRSEYAPGVEFGGNIKIQNSILKAANATWRVYGLEYDLSSQVSNGPRFMDIRGTPLGAPGQGSALPVVS